MAQVRVDGYVHGVESAVPPPSALLIRWRPPYLACGIHIFLWSCVHTRTHITFIVAVNASISAAKRPRALHEKKTRRAKSRYRVPDHPVKPGAVGEDSSVTVIDPWTNPIRANHKRPTMQVLSQRPVPLTKLRRHLCTSPAGQPSLRRVRDIATGATREIVSLPSQESGSDTAHDSLFPNAVLWREHAARGLISFTLGNSELGTIVM